MVWDINKIKMIKKLKSEMYRGYRLETHKLSGDDIEEGFTTIGYLYHKGKSITSDYNGSITFVEDSKEEMLKQMKGYVDDVIKENKGR